MSPPHQSHYLDPTSCALCAHASNTDKTRQILQTEQIHDVNTCDLSHAPRVKRAVNVNQLGVVKIEGIKQKTRAAASMM
jgi:hypothetical protein